MAHVQLTRYMNDEFIIHQDELDLPPRRRFPNWPHWRRALKWLFVTLLVVTLAVAAFVAINLFKVSVNPFGFGHLKGEDQGRVNIMMLGVGDPGHDGENLSDTNILISVDTRNHKVALVSIPRDTRVYIPGYGYSKINNANAQGGVSAAKQVFENSLGVPVHYYVKADFTGLKQVVDAVGGVDIDNKDSLYDPEYPCDNNQYRSCGFRLTPGHYHMDGTLALKYARCRKGTCGNDFGRAARQQQVMEAIRAKATSAGTLANPIALGRLVSAAGNNIDTDLSVNNVLRLNELTKGATQGNIFNIVFNTDPDGFLVQSNNSSDLLPKGGDFSDIQQFVQNIFKVGPIWSEHPTAIIENGSGVAGVGAKLNNTLQDDGYDLSISAVTNALTQDHAVSQVIDYTNGAKPHTRDYLLGLLKLQQATPPPTTTSTRTTPPADFVIILGTDYANRSNPGTSGGSATPTQ